MINQDIQPDTTQPSPDRSDYVEDAPKGPKMKRYILLTRAQVNGGIQEPGFKFSLHEGVLGPHKTVMGSDHGANVVGHPGALLDVPLYAELDEEVEREREEMRARHAEELAKLDGSAERAALLARQSEESRALGVKAAEREVQTRQEREAQELSDRQKVETEAFDTREKSDPVFPVVPPSETDKAALEARHNAEADALEAKHAAEQAEIEAQKEALAKQENDMPVFAPSVADEDFTPTQVPPTVEPETAKV